MEKLTSAPFVGIIVLLLFSLCSGVGAAESFSPQIDALERQLELRRHKGLAAVKADPNIQPNGFTTDGCSGGLSVGWVYLADKIGHLQSIHGATPPWESCCVTHDKRYHLAGGRQDTPAQSFEGRKEADLALRACVLDIGVQRSPMLRQQYGLSAREIELIYIAIGDMMYHAVRIGGVPCTSLPWRWGYGWPDCDGLHF